MCASFSSCAHDGQNNIEKHIAHEVHATHGVGAGTVRGYAHMRCIVFPWESGGKSWSWWVCAHALHRVSMGAMRKTRCMHADAEEQTCMKLVCVQVSKKSR